jgi:hypothetical protein
MGKKDGRNEHRREDSEHDIGDSSPGDFGDSQGTHHDGKTQTMSDDDAEEWELED